LQGELQEPGEGLGIQAALVGRIRDGIAVAVERALQERSDVGALRREAFAGALRR
jgi:hypothetical protein